MTARLIDLAAVAAVVGAVEDVEALSVRVASETEITDGGRWIEVLVIDVHADSQADGARLAGVLGLPEVEGRTTVNDYDPRQMVWRKWRGWVASASQSVPVSVQVTGSDYAEDAVTKVAA